MLHGSRHGAYSAHTTDGRIYNKMYNHGEMIAWEQVSASRAFFHKDGTPQNISADKDWKDYINKSPI